MSNHLFPQGSDGQQNSCRRAYEASRLKRWMAAFEALQSAASADVLDATAYETLRIRMDEEKAERSAYDHARRALGSS